jgi:hypothetical protein
MQGDRVDSWFLVVGSQIVKLTFDPSFGHNLCFRCPNGSCDPTLDIYVPRAFQWYKTLSNLMGFDPCNRSLKIRKSTWTPTPKMGAHSLGSVSVHSHTLPHSWASFLACTLARPCLGREPNVKVATLMNSCLPMVRPCTKGVLVAH